MNLFFAAAALSGLAVGIATAPAQEVTTLIQFTNTWNYDQTGRDLGIRWRTNNYVVDALWQSGRGLLGLEDGQATLLAYNQHAPISTPLFSSSTVTTYYFRTTFMFSGSKNGLSLVASNLVDDGCVIYLNGVTVGRLRMPPEYNATTTATGVSPEGQLETIVMTDLAALRVGPNLLAAEVHQSVNTSIDNMWGMKLMAIRQLPLVITNQPQSQTVTAGETVRLSVGASGGPGYYRWERDGVLLPSTSNSLTIANAQLGNAGGYRVIITNHVSAVTSRVATVTVLADLSGPRLLAAIGHNTAPGGGSPFGSNTINVTYSEIVNTTSVRRVSNYILSRMGSTNPVSLLNVLYHPALGALLNVDGSDPDWIYGHDYVLTVNNVTDVWGNAIAPDSQMAVSWPRTTNIVDIVHPWSFHNSWFFDPDAIATNWYACDFVEGPWWASGYGPFCGGVLSPSPPPAVPCLGCATQVGFQPEPALFRTWFNWQTGLPITDITLLLRYAVDDGAVFYLNGVEIFRVNLPGGPIHSATKAATNIVTTPMCVTNASLVVTNLVSGSNCLAAAVFQSNIATGADIFFALEFGVRYLVTPGLPLGPEPILAIAPLDTDRVRLSWTGSGYALESATNLSFGAASYPSGPWQQVTNMSNPYTNRLDEPQRFFRLKK